MLKIITPKISGLNYCLVGSVNLQLQGIEIVPRDLDILTDEAGLKEIVAIFADKQTKKVYFDKTYGRNSWRTFFDSDGVEVEVLQNVSNLHRSKNELNEAVECDVDGLAVKCSSLENELKFYSGIGREDKVALIKNKLGV